MVALPAFGVFQGKRQIDDFGAARSGLDSRTRLDAREIDQQALELSRQAAGGDQNALQALLGLKPQQAGQIQQFGIRGAQEGRAQRKEISDTQAENLQFVGTSLQSILNSPKEQRPAMTLRVLRGFQQRNIPLPADLPDPDDPNFEAELRGEIAAAGKEIEASGRDPQSPVGKLAEDLRSGVLSQEQFDAAFRKATTTQPLVVNNIGSDGIDYGKPPKDFAWARNEDGTVALRKDPESGFSSPIAIPIAGGPVEAERQGEQAAADTRAGQKAQAADVVVEDIGRVREILNSPEEFPVTGLFSGASFIPGTVAHDAQALLDTVKSNIGFDRLQQMRENSPTGGALGPVSDFENKLLQATAGNLALSQTKEQLERNLDRVEDAYNAAVHGPVEAARRTLEREQQRGGGRGNTFEVKDGKLVPVP